jgi:phosphoribosylformylglycinamidine cyclo-ligase
MTSVMTQSRRSAAVVAASAVRPWPEESTQSLRLAERSRMHNASSGSIAGSRRIAGATLPGFSTGFQIEPGDIHLAMTSDGIGTKVEIAERVGRFDTLGFDLLAMVLDDLMAVGADPFGLTNVLDVSQEDSAVLDALADGLVRAAREANVALLGGELATLGERVAGFGRGPYVSWSATALGTYAPPFQSVTGDLVAPGNVVIALSEPGFRCNGFTRIRGILHATYGNDFHRSAPKDHPDVPWGEHLLLPSTIYTPALRRLIRSGAKPTGMVHVTGGGIPRKLARALRTSGLGACLDNLFPLPGPADELIALAASTQRAMSRGEAHETWGLGHGFLLIVDPAEVSSTLAILASHGPRVVGAIERLREIRIVARGEHGEDLLWA